MKKKKITKSFAERIINKIDLEGIDYWITNYGSDVDGTFLEPLVTRAKEALDELDDALEKLSEEFHIDET